MNQIFITPPISHLELSELGTNNFYCLGQIYVKNEDYRNYAKKAKEDGRFIILDSGVGDHGKPLSNEELFEVAKDLLPDEIIPLDTLYNSQETINNVIFMHKWLSEANIDDKVKIFMCPQGNTYEEWLNCYKWALEDLRVSTIGLSKKTIPHILFPDAKPDEFIGESRNIIYSILKISGLIQKPIHMLGSGGPKEYHAYSGDDLIRSTDSCVAVWEGMNENFFIDPEYKRIPTPADYFSKDLTAEQIEDAKLNIKYFYDIANSPAKKM